MTEPIYFYRNAPRTSPTGVVLEIGGFVIVGQQKPPVGSVAKWPDEQGWQQGPASSPQERPGRHHGAPGPAESLAVWPRSSQGRLSRRCKSSSSAPQLVPKGATASSAVLCPLALVPQQSEELDRVWRGTRSWMARMRRDTAAAPIARLALAALARLQ